MAYQKSGHNQMNRIKCNWGKLVFASALVVGGSSGAFATDPVAFDYSTFNTILTGGLVVVAGTAGSIAAIKGGVMVWKKIASYFNRAG